MADDAASSSVPSIAAGVRSCAAPTSTAAVPTQRFTAAIIGADIHTSDTFRASTLASDFMDGLTIRGPRRSPGDGVGADRRGTVSTEDISRPIQLTQRRLSGSLIT